MKHLSDFTNKYQISKTLRFKLIPLGKTEEFIKRGQFIENDERRENEYKKSKVLLMNTINCSSPKSCRRLNCHFAKSNLFTTGMPTVEATLNARKTSKTFKRLCANNRQRFH